MALVGLLGLARNGPNTAPPDEQDGRVGASPSLTANMRESIVKLQPNNQSVKPFSCHSNGPRKPYSLISRCTGGNVHDRHAKCTCIRTEEHHHEMTQMNNQRLIGAIQPGGVAEIQCVNGIRSP